MSYCVRASGGRLSDSRAVGVLRYGLWLPVWVTFAGKTPAFVTSCECCFLSSLAELVTVFCQLPLFSQSGS